MNTGKTTTALRDKQRWSQAELADNSGVSRVMVGKYERDEAVPSIDAAKKITDALEVSLYNLVGGGLMSGFDKKILKRSRDLEKLSQKDKELAFEALDSFISNRKIKNVLQ